MIKQQAAKVPKMVANTTASVLLEEEVVASLPWFAIQELEIKFVYKCYLCS
jgi:hypothetical protein